MGPRVPPQPDELRPMPIEAPQWVEDLALRAKIRPTGEPWRGLG